jgi:hypothetical protein
MKVRFNEQAVSRSSWFRNLQGTWPDNLSALVDFIQDELIRRGYRRVSPQHIFDRSGQVEFPKDTVPSLEQGQFRLLIESRTGYHNPGSYYTDFYFIEIAPLPDDPEHMLGAIISERIDRIVGTDA